MFYPTYPNPMSAENLNALTDQYTLKNTSFNFMNIVYAAGDFQYLCPSNLMADYFAQYGMNVYKYFFSNLATNWHGGDVAYYFGAVTTPPDEASFSQKLMTYWRNFVHENDPNVNVRLKWPIYTTNSMRPYLNEDKNDFNISFNVKTEYCAVWDKIYQ